MRILAQIADQNHFVDAAGHDASLPTRRRSDAYGRRPKAASSPRPPLMPQSHGNSVRLSATFPQSACAPIVWRRRGSTLHSFCERRAERFSTFFVCSSIAAPAAQAPARIASFHKGPHGERQILQAPPRGRAGRKAVRRPDDRGARGARAQSQERRPDHPARQAGRLHRPVGLGQVVARLRHHLRRRAAPLRRVAVGLRAPVPRR